MVARPLTIVQMLPELKGGGVERGTLELGRFLVRAGHKSLVISQGGRLVGLLKRQGSIHLRYPFVGEKSPRALLSILRLRRDILRHRVDILHLRSRIPAWVGYLAWKSLPAKKRPVLVTTFHGFYSVNRYSAVMTRGEKVIAVSRTIGEHIRSAYNIDREKIVVIYRGVDIGEFDPRKVEENRVAELRSAWDIRPDAGPVILLPARMTRLKGHDVFFSALAMLRDQDWQAVCVGQIDENSYYVNELRRGLVEAGLAERVRMVDHCQDMAAAMTLADIVVSASREPESFGRTVVEAQAMERPVIATAHGGSMETVEPGETGLLARPGDATSLARSLHALLADRTLRQLLGRAGREQVLKNFTVERMCSQTLALYDSLLEQKAC
ncbi:glycosyltransferase family 4 protein [Desulfolithobacter sp.]